MVVEFTDREYAMIVDCIQVVRDQAIASGTVIDTPETDALLRKLYGWCEPRGCGFLAVTGADAIAVQSATDSDHDHYSQRVTDLYCAGDFVEDDDIAEATGGA